MNTANTIGFFLALNATTEQVLECIDSMRSFYGIEDNGSVSPTQDKALTQQSAPPLGDNNVAAPSAEMMVASNVIRFFLMASPIVRGWDLRLT